MKPLQPWRQGKIGKLRWITRRPRPADIGDEACSSIGQITTASSARASQRTSCRVGLMFFHCRTVEMSQPMCPRKNLQCSLILAAVIQVNADRADPRHNIDGRLDTRHAGLLGPSTESRDLDLVFHCNRQIPIPKGSPVCPLSLVKQSGANERFALGHGPSGTTSRKPKTPLELETAAG